MVLSAAGQMLVTEWNVLPHRFPMIGLDAFIVMPNHVHGIIVMITNHESDPVGAGLVPAPSDQWAPMVPAPSNHRATTRVAPTRIGDVVGAFKSLTTVLYTHGVQQLMWPAFDKRLWQRNYHEHIIRDDATLQPIREYVITNPGRWALDEENPT